MTWRKTRHAISRPTRRTAPRPAGADAQGEAFVNGPFTAKPKISTGAGDHFNAGFVVGRLLGLGVAHSLQLAVAASGFYVRHAVSPNREQLVRFLQTL